MYPLVPCSCMRLVDHTVVCLLYFGLKFCGSFTFCAVRRALGPARATPYVHTVVRVGYRVRNVENRPDSGGSLILIFVSSQTRIPKQLSAIRLGCNVQIRTREVICLPPVACIL
jgi:hypothetical protein